jgi:hypothetical protein
MSEGGRKYVDQCRYLARRLRLEACKAPGVPVTVRFGAEDVEAMAWMLERAGATMEQGLRFMERRRGMDASRPYRQAVEREVAQAIVFGAVVGIVVHSSLQTLIVLLRWWLP